MPAGRKSESAVSRAPAALQYALLGEGDEVAELREMFENLLATSMDRETASRAHPAFVSIIQQLTPDEARILKSIDRDDFALVHVYQHTLGGRRLVDTKTLLGHGLEIDETRTSEHVSNLERLGILRVSDRESSDLAAQDRLIAELEAQVLGRGVQSENGSLEVTPFGVQFLNACVRVRSDVGGDGSE